MSDCLVLGLVRNRTRLSGSEITDDIISDFVSEAQVCFELETEATYDEDSLLHRGVIADLASYNLLSSFLTLSSTNTGNGDEVTIGPLTVASNNPAILMYKAGARLWDQAKRKMEFIKRDLSLRGGKIALAKSTYSDPVRRRYSNAFLKFFYSPQTLATNNIFEADFRGVDPDRLLADGSCCLDCGLIIFSCTC